MLGALQRSGGFSAITQSRRTSDYADREIDCQQAMGPGIQAILDRMIEADWTRDEAKRSIRRLIAADYMTHKETPGPKQSSRWRLP